MFKFLLIPVFFLRELVFNKEEEYTFSHPEFDTKKFIIFVILLLSITLNGLLLYRTISLAIELNKVKKFTISLIEYKQTMELKALKESSEETKD